mgnify:CR=1 FL=1
MRTAAYKVGVASDRRRRQNVPGTFFVIYTRPLDKRITIVYHQNYESYYDSYMEVIYVRL